MSNEAIRWFAEGIPAPQGSKSAFVCKHTGRARMIESSNRRLKAWRAAVKLQSKGKASFDGPVLIHLNFWLPRPKNEIRSNGDLKDWAPMHHVKRPDTDKLTRAVCDALTNAEVYKDDSYVVQLVAKKSYAPSPEQTGCWIAVQRME